MTKIIIRDAAVTIFGAFFLYAALSKLFDFDVFVSDLGRDPWIGKRIAFPLAIILPTIEILIAFFLLIPRNKKTGVLSFAILMGLFTAYVGIMMHSKLKHCTCGGFMREMTWRQHFIFNLVITTLAFIIVKLEMSMKYNKQIIKFNPIK